MRKVIYIAGPISGMLEGNKAAFMEAEYALTSAGYTVLNPRRLPVGMQAGRYMPICLAMVQQSDMVALLPGWEKSRGAQIEKGLALYQGIPVWPIERLCPDWDWLARIARQIAQGNGPAED